MPSTLPDGEAVPATGELPEPALRGLGTRPFGFYVHVPFCVTRCGYCDFNTYTAQELGPGASRADYAETAVAEVRLDDFRDRLRDQANPGRAIEPLEGPFAAVLAALDRVSPDALAKPLEDELGRVVDAVLAPPLAALDGVLAPIASVVERTRTVSTVLDDGLGLIGRLRSLLEGIAEIVVSPATLPHPVRADVYTLGECIPLPATADDVDSIQSRVVLYHGSFQALARIDPGFDWREEAWETLTHEIRHHLEWRARAPALEALDAAAEANFARQSGEPFDPGFYLDGEKAGEGIYRIDDDFFLEIQDHGLGLREEKAVNESLFALARREGMKTVATNDCHYISRDDAEAHDILLCIGTGRKSQDQNRMRYPGDQFYFKSSEEMAALFQGYQEAYDNTLSIAERVSVDLERDGFQLPRFQVP